MKKKKLLTVLAAIFVLALGVGIGAYAASSYGTQSDPLVAKSYLDNVLTPQLQQQFQSQLDAGVNTLEQEIDAANATKSGNFSAVSLAKGQTLNGSTGCELILRSGSVSVSGSAGLADVTDGALISSGSNVTQNHLLTVAADGNGVTAAAAATLLVRGSYTIG